MRRVLTGIQSSGRLHLGNILGSVLPSITLSKKQDSCSFFFIADLHSLTTIKDAKARKESIYSIASAWLAFGFNDEENIFYRQSRIEGICELAWYLSCFTQYSRLINAHSFKDKKGQLSDINGGLFTYPILMAADILIQDANVVPVGRDQKQHIEITREIAKSFNRQYGDILVIPNAKIREDTQIVVGTDGRKMSKSYKNYIDIFAPKSDLKKQIMSIITDNKTLKDKKDPTSCNIFKIYTLLATEYEIKQMEDRYRSGGYGYGEAKIELLELILRKFKKQRELFKYYMSNLDEVESRLVAGEKKANASQNVIQKVRKCLGFN